MHWLSATTQAAADWGNVPGWIAVGVSALGSGIAVRISWKAKNAAERSASASERSAAASEASAANGARSADTAAEALKLQQRAAQPRVKLVIRIAGRGVYRLANDGDAPAAGLTLHPDDVRRIEGVDGNLPDNLQPNASWDFMATTPANTPSNLRFTWDGQADPSHVQMPSM